MRYANDCPVQPCALLAVTVRSAGQSHEVTALAVLGEWAATPVLRTDGTTDDSRYHIVHVATGCAAVSATLTQRDALRVIDKLRDVRVTPGTYETIYTNVVAAFPAHVRKRVPTSVVPVSYAARTLLAQERAA